MVYFIQSVDGGPVKIGHTADVDSRIRQLEVKFGTPLVVLATMPGGREAEKVVHQRFSHLRFGRTEQFQPAAELMQFIGKPLFVNASPVELMEDHEKPLVAFRCTASFKSYLEKIADAETRTPTQVIERALEAYAKAGGYEPFPKR